ncbi:ERCC4 domain-containing protein [Rhypophila decipiens]|uniref:ERCC4 domain-containing protein n=1 Tax=Rhypophila decipiens TaxID=261697 RepID=A0AAN6Y0Y6_9PEZI|nr:ERCC4 domain-containing protein [Rhypophila decipiens]
MTFEVISLLSSPDRGSPPPPPPAAARPRKSTSPVERRAIPAYDALDSDDPFDQDVQVAQDDNAIAQHTKQPSFAAFRTLSRKQVVTIPASDDIWSLDDDDFLKSPSPKRQRLSTDGSNLTRRTAIGAKPTTGSRRWSPSVDQLDFTSPVRESTKPTNQRTPAFPDDDDDDPFASPSPLRETPIDLTAPAARSSIIPAINLDGESDDGLFVSNDTPKRKDRKQKAPGLAVPWDPISSSAPPPTAPRNLVVQPARHMQRSVSEIITLDDSDDDNFATRIESSEDEFPDIGKLDASNRLSRIPRGKQPARLRTLGATKPKVARKPARKTAEEVAKEREEKVAAREAERERKRQEAKQAKEDKALEKQMAAALAEVNKVRTDKKVSTPEMIVQLPDTLPASQKLQAETLLKDLDVQAESWRCPIENVVKWKRKVRSRFNEELGHWEPISMRIEEEKYAMVIMPFGEFVRRVLATDNSDALESHVLLMQRAFPDHTIIYLIEALDTWMRKNRNLRNRQYVSAVLGDQPPPSTQARRRKNNEPTEYVDEDKIEDALLQLQVLHGVLIHHTNAEIETAQWIAIFTQHISTVPYRRQKEESNAAGAGFCMETGQVRTGDGAKDTYIRMLQEIGRVTAPVAYGIAAEFGSVPELVRGLEESGPLTLEGVKKSANRDGALTDRSVGQAMSKRIYKIFTGKDATSTEI